MRKREEEDADVEARIAQIEQTTLEQIAVFQGRILADITKGRVSPRDASALDRALKKRLKVIEQELHRAWLAASAETFRGRGAIGPALSMLRCGIAISAPRCRFQPYQSAQWNRYTAVS